MMGAGQMARRWLAAMLAGVLFTAAPALAQAQSGALPPTIASAGVTQAQWDAIRREARAQAQRARVSEAALLATAEAAGANLARSGRFNASALQGAI